MAERAGRPEGVRDTAGAGVKPVIIEVAINGGADKARNPHVPRDPEEVAAVALECMAAGAAIVHSHIEDMATTGDAAAERYAQAYRLVRARRSDAILYPTLTLSSDIANKLAHVAPLAREGLIEMAAFDPGSTNFGFMPGADGLPTRDFVYINSYSDIRQAFELCAREGVGPSLAIYEPSFLRATLGWHRAGHLPAGSFVKFYFGGEYGLGGTGETSDFTFGLPPTEKALEAYLEMMEGSGLPWATAVLGGDLVASGMAALTLDRGGHLRIGLEDYGGREAPSNIALVEEAAALCRAMGRRLATPDEARAILGLKARAEA